MSDSLKYDFTCYKILRSTKPLFQLVYSCIKYFYLAQNLHKLPVVCFCTLYNIKMNLQDVQLENES